MYRQQYARLKEINIHEGSHLIIDVNENVRVFGNNIDGQLGMENIDKHI
jgi:hypothetical protein